MTALGSLKSETKDRATRPGPSVVRRVGIALLLAVLCSALGYGIYGLSTPRAANYSDPASWLPRQQLDHPIDQTVAGSYSNPALTVEGEYVAVRTPTFSALAIVNGPVVPGEGLPYQQSFTTCTWTISLTHVTGRVPLSVADFDSIDHTGEVFVPHLVPGEAKLPATIATGGHITFQLRAVMPVGEGLMRWAPDGEHIVAKWDYQVEND